MRNQASHNFQKPMAARSVDRSSRGLRGVLHELAGLGGLRREKLVRRLERTRSARSSGEGCPRWRFSCGTSREAPTDATLFDAGLVCAQRIIEGRGES